MRGRRDLWILVVRGVAAIVFGLLALAWPSLTVLVLTVLFGAYALVNGAFTLGAATGRGQPGALRTLLVLTGLLGLLAGVVTLVWPTITTLALTVVIGAWAIATGLLDVWTAVRHRGSWLLALVGVVAIAA